MLSPGVLVLRSHAVLLCERVFGPTVYLGCRIQCGCAGTLTCDLLDYFSANSTLSSVRAAMTSRGSSVLFSSLSSSNTLCVSVPRHDCGAGGPRPVHHHHLQTRAAGVGRQVLRSQVQKQGALWGTRVTFIRQQKTVSNSNRQL